MEDELLVSRAIAGDLDSFGQLYDRYVDKVYDFAWRVLRDAAEAATVTEEVFVRAARELRVLSKGVAFKPWLFTLAHHAAVSRAERAAPAPGPVPAHEEAFGGFDVPDPCRVDDPSLVGGDHELACLVWEAASSLGPRDYALLDLSVRQGLESAEVAHAIGAGRSGASTMVTRMKQAAEDVIAGYVVARRGVRDCEQLSTLLAGFMLPPYTDEARRAVDAHVKICDVCQRSRKLPVAPLTVFGAFAALPVPFALKGEIWRGIAGAWGSPAEAGVVGFGDTTGAPSAAAAGARIALSAGGGGYGGAIDAVALGGEEPGWRRIALFAGAAVGILMFAIVGGTLLASAFGGLGGDGGAGGATAATRTPAGATGTPGATRTLGVLIETPTPNPNPSATPEPTATDTAVPASPTPPPPPPEPTATSTRIAVRTTAPPSATPTTPQKATPTPKVPTPTRTPKPPDG